MKTEIWGADGGHIGSFSRSEHGGKDGTIFQAEITCLGVKHFDAWWHYVLAMFHQEIDKLQEPKEVENAISASITLRQATARKMLSVRLANALHAHFGKEKYDSMSLAELVDAFGGYPLPPEFEREFLRWPNVGRKALNEIKALLSRVEQPSKGTVTKEGL
jgi:hypothetical protein